MEFDPDCSALILLNLIEKYILPSSTIHSDCWKSYKNIKLLPVVPKYDHKTVNHKKYFVDPITGVHTNLVEVMWKNCKAKFKTMAGVHSHMLPSYIDEFLWRQRFRGDVHQNLMEHIAEKTGF